MQKTMGEEIARLRKAGGMTQAELAEKLSVTDKAVSKWERGLACPDIGTLPRLSDILGISVDELLNCREPEKKAEKENFRELFLLILRAVALAMGVAAAVLITLEQIEIRSALTMLSLGLAALALYSLEEKRPKE